MDLSLCIMGIDLTSWSGREREWYYSEKRLLFATPNEREREVWVSVLNWFFKFLAGEEGEHQDMHSNAQDVSGIEIN